MDDTHKCPKDGCGEQVPFEVLACRAHWFSLPSGVRRMIWRAWHDGNLAEHARLRRLAVAMLNEVKA